MTVSQQIMYMTPDEGDNLVTVGTLAEARALIHEIKEGRT